MLYASFFRTSVLFVGAMSMYLGYRLFTVRTGASVASAKPEKSEQSELVVRTDKVQLALRSTAPGIFFSFFGVILIVSMIVSASPELRMTSDDDESSIARSIYLRSARSDSVETFLANYDQGYYDEDPQSGLDTIVNILKRN